MGDSLLGRRCRCHGADKFRRATRRPAAHSSCTDRLCTVVGSCTGPWRRWPWLAVGVGGVGDGVCMTAESVGTQPGRRARVARLGEDLAAEFVTGLGWSIIARNWRNRYGELDLIAFDGRRLIVVEVKTRASRVFGDPVAAVTPEKLRRIRKLTRMWLAQQEMRWPAIRFDVISVRLDPAHPEARAGAEVRHHVNVVE